MTTRIHHLVIGGFGQYRGKLAGVDYVVDALDRFRQPGVRVSLLPWSHDWKAEAGYIRRHAPLDTRDQQPLVCLYAYSWGVGNGAVQLARQLQRREIGVWGLISCDGVYHHRAVLCRWLPQWRSLWPGSRIWLPPNVRRGGVRVFRQRNGLPSGHEIVDHHGHAYHAEEIHDVLRDNRFVERASHFNLDESPRWHRACVDLAEQAQLECEGRETF